MIIERLIAILKKEEEKLELKECNVEGKLALMNNYYPILDFEGMTFTNVINYIEDDIPSEMEIIYNNQFYLEVFDVKPNENVDICYCYYKGGLKKSEKSQIIHLEKFI